MTKPPHSNEAEMCLLGAALVAGVDRIAGHLREDDFYAEKHRSIWRACLDLDAAGERIDVVSVGDKLPDLASYLITLANDTPGPANMAGWARIIREKSTLRRLIDLSVELGERAMGDEKPEEIVSDIQQNLLDWSGADFTGGKTLKEHAAAWLDYMHDTSGEPCTTGLVDVDAGMMGMMPGELIILAGRPGSGKSAGAMQIAQHNSRSRAVHVFSLEMSGAEIISRMAANGVDPQRLRDPAKMQAQDWARVRQGLGALKANDLIIDDTAGLTINQVCARARYTHKRHKTALIVIDYLQLISAPTKDGRTQEISIISRALKKLAKDLKVPVLALSQLNRGVETRTDKRPTMADLRESGQLEQDADQIVFLYRHAYYHEDFSSNVSEWIRAKHRHGSTGKHFVMWLPEKTKFGNADSGAIAHYKAMLEPPVKVGKFRMGRS